MDALKIGTSWSRTNHKYVILLVRLAFLYVLKHSLARCSSHIVPKLFPLTPNVYPAVAGHGRRGSSNPRRPYEPANRSRERQTFHDDSLPADVSKTRSHVPDQSDRLISAVLRHPGMPYLIRTCVTAVKVRCPVGIARNHKDADALDGVRRTAGNNLMRPRCVPTLFWLGTYLHFPKGRCLRRNLLAFLGSDFGRPDSSHAVKESFRSLSPL